VINQRVDGGLELPLKVVQARMTTEGEAVPKYPGIEGGAKKNGVGGTDAVLVWSALAPG